MAYVPLQSKLASLKHLDPLPLGMLREIAENNPRFTLFKNATQSIKLIDCYQLATQFYFLKWTEVDRSVKPHLFLEAKGEVTFQDGSKVRISLDQSFFYKAEELSFRYRDVYFKQLKPGKLALVAEEEAWVLSEEELIMGSQDDHQQDGMKIPEGTPVVVLQTVALDKIPLVKILIADDVKWTYAALFDQDTFDKTPNPNHWL